MPALRDGMRLIDIGAGHANYAKLLGIEHWEPYHHNGRSIDVGAGRADYERLIASLAERGRYEAVVVDSVLNSTDCLEAEASLMAMVNALALPGATVWASGRPRSRIEEEMRFRKITAKSNWMKFLDADGYTANLRQGNWYYQRYHTEEQVRELASSHGLSISRYECDGNSWRAEMVKVSEDAMSERGLRYEGSLPLPMGRYDYGDALVGAWLKAVSA